MKILVADDDEVTKMLITESLKQWGYSTLSASNGQEVLSIVSNHPDLQLFVLDWEMPEINGIQLCEKLKTQSQPYRHLIILTGRNKLKNIKHAFDAGANDFISKPLIHDELFVRLKFAERIIELENKVVETLFSSKNSLNHSAVLDELDRLWERSKRDLSPLSILVVNIDSLKKINDAFSHVTGDLLIKKVEETLAKELRPYDCIGVTSGDEFIITLASSTSDSALLAAERMRHNISAQPIIFNNESICITVSIGVASFCENQTNYKDLLLRAKQALYQAKSDGRNCVRYK